MKRIMLSLIMVLVLLLLPACNSNNDATTVKNGNYIFLQTGTEAGLSPYINISDDSISFCYDLLSSYFPVGTYVIEKDMLTMITNDRLYKYVFLIDGDKLIFQKNESSKLKFTHTKYGVKITDNTEFKLSDN